MGKKSWFDIIVLINRIFIVVVWALTIFKVIPKELSSFMIMVYAAIELVDFIGNWFPKRCRQQHKEGHENDSVIRPGETDDSET